MLSPRKELESRLCRLLRSDKKPFLPPRELQSRQKKLDPCSSEPQRRGYFLGTPSPQSRDCSKLSGHGENGFARGENIRRFRARCSVVAANFSEHGAQNCNTRENCCNASAPEPAKASRQRIDAARSRIGRQKFTATRQNQRPLHPASHASTSVPPVTGVEQTVHGHDSGFGLVVASS